MNIVARSLVLSFLCGSVLAATTLGPQAWQRYSGTRIVAGPFATLDECARGAADGNTCRVSVRITVTPDPPACPSQPANETQPGACPVGTTGSWTQSRSYISAPHPTCWTAGDWVPAEPPTGACVLPPPPTTVEWTRCATQGQVCQFTGTRTLRYGLGTTWAQGAREANPALGGLICDKTLDFGNPLPGVTKVCELQGAAPPPPTEPPPPTGNGTATLRWTPPTQNEDNTALTNLAGHRAYCTQGGAVRLVEVASPSTTAVVDRLATGPWICYATAFNSNGVESAPSNTVTKVIP